MFNFNYSIVNMLERRNIYFPEQNVTQLLYLVGANYKIEAIKFIRARGEGRTDLKSTKNAVEEIQRVVDSLLDIKRYY